MKVMLALSALAELVARAGEVPDAGQVVAGNRQQGYKVVQRKKREMIAAFCAMMKTSEPRTDKVLSRRETTVGLER